MPERNDRRRGRLGVLVVLVASLLAACSVDPPPARLDTVDAAAGPVRIDGAPIARRFPGLAGSASVHWVSGRIGGTTDRAESGPSDTFLQVVVVVPVETHTRLLQQPGLGRSDPPTGVVSNLGPLLPAGDGWMAEEYPNAVETTWKTRLWIRPDSAVVYITSTST